MNLISSEISLGRYELLDLSPTLHGFLNCVIHIFEFAVILEYSSINNPIIKTQRDLNLTAVITTPKIQFSSCLVSLFSVGELKNDPRKSAPHLAPMIEFGKRQSFDTKDHWAILILHSRENYYLANLGSGLLYMVNKYVDAEQDVPFFVFYYIEEEMTRIQTLSNEVAPLVVPNGSFICWYCLDAVHHSRRYEYLLHAFPFECGPLSNCTGPMLDLYNQLIKNGRSVRWTLRADYMPSQSLCLECGSPFGVGNRSKMATVEGAVLGYIQQGFNYTEEILDRIVLFEPIFRAVKQSTYTWNMRPLLTGSYHMYNFITSDGATIESIYKSLVAPFHYIAWIILAIAPVLLVALSRFFPTNSSSREMGNSLYNLYVMMVNQVSSRFQTLRLPKPILFCWVFVTIVLGSMYQSELNCQYITGPVAVRWKHLSELKSFTLFVPIQAPSRYMSFHKTNLKEMIRDGFSIETYCYINSIVGCSFPVDLVHYSVSLLLQDDFKTSKLVNNTLRNIEFVAEEELALMIHLNMTTPGTALVASTDRFHQYWRLFEDAMLTNSSLQFHHNLDVKDTWGATMRGFEARFLNRHHDGGIPDRWSGLISSGFYSLWEQWSKIHLRLRPRLESRKHHLYSLSLDSPTTEASFHIVFYGWIGSAIAWILEIIMRRFPRIGQYKT